MSDLSNHPKYQLMPAMDAVEYAALMQNIKEHGVKVAVEYDEAGEILDGHHRVQICAELGIANFPKIIRKKLTEQEKRAHVRSLNLARRHLNRERRRELIGDQLIDTPWLSNRQIAGIIGADHHTVGKVRDEFVSQGKLSHQSKLQDTQGRWQPSTKANLPALPAQKLFWRSMAIIDGRELLELQWFEIAKVREALLLDAMWLDKISKSIANPNHLDSISDQLSPKKLQLLLDEVQ